MVWQAPQGSGVGSGVLPHTDRRMKLEWQKDGHSIWPLLVVASAGDARLEMWAVGEQWLARTTGVGCAEDRRDADDEIEWQKDGHSW